VCQFCNDFFRKGGAILRLNYTLAEAAAYANLPQLWDRHSTVVLRFVWSTVHLIRDPVFSEADAVVEFGGVHSGAEQPGQKRIPVESTPEHWDLMPWWERNTVLMRGNKITPAVHQSLLWFRKFFNFTIAGTKLVCLYICTELTCADDACQVSCLNYKKSSWWCVLTTCLPSPGTRILSRHT